MIRILKKQSNTTAPAYKFWVSTKITCRHNSDINSVTITLLSMLTDYLNNNKQLKLVSYNFIHDNGNPYYNYWAITAIFKDI